VGRLMCEGSFVTDITEPAGQGTLVKG
jgi:hypothetical protein